ncbi:MAG: alpha/beta fold hydrolase [Solirubrobacterales bacterium]
MSTAIRADSAIPASLRTLVDRFDHERFDLAAQRAVVMLATGPDEGWNVAIDRKRAVLSRSGSERPAALLSADRSTWDEIADDLSGGLGAFGAGRLRVRHNLHLAVGFLAATARATGPGQLRFRRITTRMGDFSTLEAGIGEPVIMLHGLGGTKWSFLPTVAALAPSYRMIAVDLLGFGDSDKPVGASYTPDFQARGVSALLDALEIERAHVIGHSMGGRVALEFGMRRPHRVIGLVLMTPAMAWLRERRWAPYLRWIRPELGLIQVTPRPVVEAVVRRLIPGASSSWGTAGIDEFIRTYTDPRGRAAFYAAARSIYLDEPHGDRGFWTSLRRLAPECLFIWGTHDRLAPIEFAKHVERVLPSARHVELDCGHIPQIERPRELHAAIAEFLATVEPVASADLGAGLVDS